MTLSGAHRGTGAHPLKLFYPDPRVSVRAHFFPIRVISLWNRLATPIVNAENSHSNVQKVIKAR